MLNQRRIPFVLLLLGAFALSGCGQPPQIGSDETVFNEVDALYTAVTARRVDLLDQCRERLDNLHRNGSLSSDAYEELTAICQQAKQSDWQSAAETLYDFMRGQRKAT